MIHFIKQNSCILAFFKKDLNCSPLHLGGGTLKKFTGRYFVGTRTKKIIGNFQFFTHPPPPLINNECSLNPQGFALHCATVLQHAIFNEQTLFHKAMLYVCFGQSIISIF